MPLDPKSLYDEYIQIQKDQGERKKQDTRVLDTVPGTWEEDWWLGRQGYHVAFDDKETHCSGEIQAKRRKGKGKKSKRVGSAYGFACEIDGTISISGTDKPAKSFIAGWMVKELESGCSKKCLPVIYSERTPGMNFEGCTKRHKRGR